MQGKSCGALGAGCRPPYVSHHIHASQDSSFNTITDPAFKEGWQMVIRKGQVSSSKPHSRPTGQVGGPLAWEGTWGLGAVRS